MKTENVKVVPVNNYRFIKLASLKKYVTQKRDIPLPPMSHSVIFCLGPTPLLITHQKVTNSGLKMIRNSMLTLGPIFAIISICPTQNVLFR